jgi:hypothetical protein
VLAISHDQLWRGFHRLLGHFYKLLDNDAANAYKKAKLRSIKDLDKAATVLATACRTLLYPALADNGLTTTQ